MIFDKNEKRIVELERQLIRNPRNQESIENRIAELRTRGSEWWISYYDNHGRKRAEKCPSKSLTAAKRLEARRKEEVYSGRYDSPDFKRVKIETVIDFYLENKKPGASAKSYAKKIKKLKGGVWLDKLDARPEILVQHFENFPEVQWSDKTKWNYFITLRAAINYWLKLKRLVMRNPCDIIPDVTGMSPNTCVREKTPSPDEFRQLITACVELEIPQWIQDLFTAAWESGLRIGEILKWKIEEIDLRIGRDEDGRIIELPYFTTYISKQRRVVQKQIPMSYGLWELLKRVIGERRSGNVWPVKNPPYHYIRDKKLMEHAGLLQYRPFHDFRKSFKVARKVEGLTQEFTKYLQGHATNSMDDHYTQFKRLDVQSAYLDEYESHSDQIVT